MRKSIRTLAVVLMAVPLTAEAGTGFHWGISHAIGSTVKDLHDKILALTPVATPVPVDTSTFTLSPTISPTWTISQTFTVSPTQTPSYTATPTFSDSPTATPSGTATASPTDSL